MKHSYLIFAYCFFFLSCHVVRKVEVFQLKGNPTALESGGFTITNFHQAMQHGSIIRHEFFDHKTKSVVRNAVRKDMYLRLDGNWHGDLLSKAGSNWPCELSTDSSSLLNVEYCIVISRLFKVDSVFLGNNRGKTLNFAKLNDDYYIVPLRFYRKINEICEAKSPTAK